MAGHNRPLDSAFFIPPSSFVLPGALCSKPGGMGAVWGQCGAGLGVVWGRPDVDCATICYFDTCEIIKVALGAPMGRIHRRRNPGAGPARPPCSALKPLRLRRARLQFQSPVDPFQIYSFTLRTIFPVGPRTITSSRRGRVWRFLPCCGRVWRRLRSGSLYRTCLCSLSRSGS